MNLKNNFLKNRLDEQILIDETKKNKKISLFGNIISKNIAYLILFFYILISIYPFIWAIFTSFKPPHLIKLTGFNPMPSSGEWTLENYRRAFTEGGLSEYATTWIKNSVIYSFSSGFLNATLNLLAGYALAQIAMKGKNILISYFLVSILVPSQATYIPTYFIFNKVGIISPDITPSLFLLGVVFSGMANIGLTFLARQFFLTQTKEMEEAGKVDGYYPISIFIKITLRKMLPLFSTQFVIVFMGSWNAFIIFQLYSGSDPSKMTLISGSLTIFNGTTDQDIAYGQALAISNVSFFPMVFIYLISLKIQLQGIKGGNK